MEVIIKGKKFTIDKTCSIKNLDNYCLTYIVNKKYITSKLYQDLLEFTNIIIFISDKILLPPTKRNAYFYVEDPFKEFQKIHNALYQDKYNNFDLVKGKNVYIGAGAVIGGQGFKVTKIDSQLQHLAHVGGVKLGNNVFLKACYIDRSLFENTYTELKESVFVDNGVHIAHNCLINKNTLIVANSVIGGSVIIGEDCWIGEGVLIRDNITIGNNVTISMGSVVTKDIGDNETVAGNFAVSKEKWIKFVKSL